MLVASDELCDLHLVYAEAIFGGDLSSVQTLLLLKQSYDWSSLRVAHGVLNDMWRQYLRKNIPLPICVLTCVDMLNRRLRGPIVPCFGHAEVMSWDFQCAMLLDDLHSDVTHHAASIQQTASPPANVTLGFV